MRYDLLVVFTRSEYMQRNYSSIIPPRTQCAVDLSVLPPNDYLVRCVPPALLFETPGPQTSYSLLVTNQLA